MFDDELMNAILEILEADGPIPADIVLVINDETGGK